MVVKNILFIIFLLSGPLLLGPNTVPCLLAYDMFYIFYLIGSYSIFIINLCIQNLNFNITLLLFISQIPCLFSFFWVNFISLRLRTLLYDCHITYTYDCRIRAWYTYACMCLLNLQSVTTKIYINRFKNKIKKDLKLNLQVTFAGSQNSI